MLSRHCLTRRLQCQPNMLMVIVYTIVAMVLGHHIVVYLQYDVVRYIRYEQSDDTFQSGRFENTGSDDYLIIGIMTTADDANVRKIIRKTWTDIDPEYIPYRVEYKFVIDNITNEVATENAIHKDIIFLNSRQHLSRNRKLFLWLKHSIVNFESATLVAKMEQDVFLCTPQIYSRLQQLRTDKLMYGSCHESGVVQSSFLVFGKKIVKRIVSNRFCAEGRCAITGSNRVNSDGEFLTKWLKLYNDIDVQWDNSNFLTSTRSDSVKKDVCKHYLVYESASLPTMRALWNINKFVGRVQTGVGSVSSAIFAGDVIRSAPDVTIGRHPTSVPNSRFSIQCEKWAVTTTIFDASLSVQNMAKRPEWCVVVVADTKSPPKAVYLGNIGPKANKVVYLEPDDQDELYPLLSRHIPWKTFGRKNIGYIFAMNHGAKFIWDFDDDNYGVVDPKLFHTDTVAMPCSPYTHNKINPYPFFGVNEANPWPRGYPLEDILNKTYSPQFCNQENTKLNIGIIQSLANLQPDVDAIYRFVRETPFSFRAKPNNTKLMVVPRFAYTPLNAQATLWSSKAFRYMYLPISVNGRVSDIWRSYFTEYFLYKDNTLVSFAPPFVNQYRNAHNILGDFNAENDIYQKVYRLIEHLSHATYDDVMSLYIDMYTHGYINSKDLTVVKAWLKTLDELNIR